MNLVNMVWKTLPARWTDLSESPPLTSLTVKAYMWMRLTEQGASWRRWEIKVGPDRWVRPERWAQAETGRFRGRYGQGREEKAGQAAWRRGWECLSRVQALSQGWGTRKGGSGWARGLREKTD